MSSKIEWCDETINPQGWGCWGPGGTPEEPRRCWYCYSEDFSKRHLSKCELCNQFIPHWHPERLELPYQWKKPRRIFWGSMSDIFHPCTPDHQIRAILDVVHETPWHIQIFCTKNPARYREFNPWPGNCWLGATVTNQEDANIRIPELLKADAKVLFVSAEPLMGPIRLEQFIHHELCPMHTGDHPCECELRLQWVIVGSMTGPCAKQPDSMDVHSLEFQCRDAGVPLFQKNNLHSVIKRAGGAGLIQEFPA